MNAVAPKHPLEDTPHGFTRNVGDYTLLDVILETTIMRQKLEHLVNSIEDYKADGRVRDEARDAAVRSAVMDAVREMVEPVTERISVIERDVMFAKWAARAAMAAAPAVPIVIEVIRRLIPAGLFLLSLGI